MNKDIEKTYIYISPFFDTWVKFMEVQTREMEARDAILKASKVLIISPPTDRGIKVLAEANRKGESYLLCFSSRIEEIAKKYLVKKNIANLKTCVNAFFHIPFPDAYFEVIFANCFFDFCQDYDIDKIIIEIKRALKDKGALFLVHMDFSANIANRAWNTIFGKISMMGHGCHPVDIAPVLAKHNFTLKKDISMERFGFPIKYIQCENQCKGTIRKIG
jgi:ubiquinone/menaquinone biosynthesis C-methylase UbiE